MVLQLEAFFTHSHPHYHFINNIYAFLKSPEYAVAIIRWMEVRIVEFFLGRVRTFFPSAKFLKRLSSLSLSLFHFRRIQAS